MNTKLSFLKSGVIATALSMVPFASAEIVSEFEKHATALPGWNEEAKTALAAEGDAASRISASLRALYPKLGPAMEAVSENPAGLLELTQSEDPFLAADPLLIAAFGRQGHQYSFSHEELTQPQNVQAGTPGDAAPEQQNKRSFFDSLKQKMRGN